MEKHFTIPPLGAYAGNKFLHADIPMNKYMFGSREEVHRVARLLTDILTPLGYYEFHPPGDPIYDPHMVSSKKIGKHNLVRIFVPYSQSKRALKFHIVMGYNVADEELIQIAKEVANALLQVQELNHPTVIKEVPHGASDPVSYEDIGEGDEMVDFDEEYRYGRYYKKETLPLLRGKNPFKNQPIQTPPTYYKAHIVQRAGSNRLRKRKTRRATKRRGKTLKKRK